METLRISATHKTPSIILDTENNLYEFSGKCLPNDAIAFFRPILKWIDLFILEPRTDSTFHFKLDYFNTASSKLILEILLKLEKAHELDNSITVKWFFNEGDDDMEEAGEDYSDLTNIPFSFESY